MQVGLGELGLLTPGSGGPGSCIQNGLGSSWRWGRWIGSKFDFGYLLGAELDVTVFAAVEVDAGMAFDLAMVVAEHIVAVAQGDALSGQRGGSEGRESSECRADWE
jgi:hypothetical protein